MYLFYLFLVFYFLGELPILAGCISGNCQNGYGSAVFPKGDIYTGEFQNGLAQGKGRLEYKNGNIFFGEWHNGKANGVGEMNYADGTRYVGEWLNSQAHGVGTIYDEDGTILYSGKWKHGKMTDNKKKR